MNAPANVTVAVTVMLLDVLVTETPEAGMLHWLFDTVPLLPGPVARSVVPESSTRSN